MEQHRGYWIHGSAIPGPPNTSYWQSLDLVLKSDRRGSIIEVDRLHDSGVEFDTRELAEWYVLELSRIAVDKCLTER